MLNGKQIGRIIHQINKISSNNLTSRTGLRFTISRNKIVSFTEATYCFLTRQWAGCTIRANRLSVNRPNKKPDRQVAASTVNIQHNYRGIYEILHNDPTKLPILSV